MGVFRKQGVWWVDYYVNGHRKRERIGPDKQLANTVLKKRKVEIAEGKFLDKRRPVTTTFDELADTYLAWVRPNERTGKPARKRSWKTHDLYAIGRMRAYFGGKRLLEITPALVEQYRDWRKATITRRKRLVTVATVNRELATLRRMFNVARRGLIVLKGGVPPDNPMAMVTLERERNERDRVLSAEEFQRLSEAAEPWLRPILLLAYYVGMRKGEIRSLRWEQVDLKTGIIRLQSSDTKTDQGRVIPLNPVLRSALSTIPPVLGCPWVFVNPAYVEAWRANPDGVNPRFHATSITHAFTRACKKAGVKNATFHDLRHTFVTNMRRAGVDYFRIMAITGHRTMSVFKRYNLIDEQDLMEAVARMDTYMDTTAAMDTRKNTVNT
jgi:integrase